MWYVLWTMAGNEENTRKMVDQHVDHKLFNRCIVPYRKKREIHQGQSVFVNKILFPSYLFIETDQIKDFAKQLQQYPGKNVILQTGDSFSPIYKEEEYFLTDMLNKDDVIDSSEGYPEGDRVRVVNGPLKGHEDRIKKVNWRRSLAILEMTLYDRKVETCLGLDRVASPVGS